MKSLENSLFKCIRCKIIISRIEKWKSQPPYHLVYNDINNKLINYNNVSSNV